MTKPSPPPLQKWPGIICGTRYPNHRAIVTINGRPLDWQASFALRNHSPTAGIEWGHPGPGPAQLALALLLQITDRTTALTFYQRFKDAVIARIRDDRWTLTITDVLDWLKHSRNHTDVVCMDVETDPGPRP